MICKTIKNKNGNLITELFIKGKHNNTGVIHWEQYTQATPSIEKANSDFFTLIPPFGIFFANYYHEKFIPYLSPNEIVRLGGLCLKYQKNKNNNQLKYLMVNKFEDVTIEYDYRVCPFEHGNYFSIIPVEYEK